MTSLIADPVSAVSAGVGKIADFIGRFVTDKTQVEKDRAALELADLMNSHAEAVAQIKVDEAEAASPDRINHWRGGLGWALTGAITWHYVLFKILTWINAAGAANGWWTLMPPLPDLSKDELSALWDLAAIMLGSHAVPHVTNAVSSIFGNGNGK